jgi:hypothetical protein
LKKEVGSGISFVSDLIVDGNLVTFNARDCSVVISRDGAFEPLHVIIDLG